MRPFSENLRAWRRHRGLTQEALAKAGGIPRPNLAFLEQGRRECTLTTLRRLAVALGVSPGTLLDRAPPHAEVPALDKYAVDAIARSLLAGRADLPAKLKPWREQAAIEARPLLQVAGVRISARGRRHLDPGERQAVLPILRRVAKLLPAHLKGVPL